jgi:SPP1 gp7 family putative phage head morphogenesis protein
MKSTLNPPDSAEREYMRKMNAYTRELAADIRQVLIPNVGNIKAQYDLESRVDAWTDYIDQLIQELLRLAGVRQQTVIAALPGLFAAVNANNERQLRLVVKANTGIDLPAAPPQPFTVTGASRLGVNPFRGEPWLKPLAEGWVAENTNLIKSVSDRQLEEVQSILRREIMAGSSVRTIQKAIMQRVPITANRAKLIAQDQTLKLHSKMSQERLKDIGVTKYIWRTVGDNRVRPHHRDRNGKTFSWNKPPSDGHPGQPVRCRCRAEPVFED